jgi:DNA recombination protein RmuC
MEAFLVGFAALAGILLGFWLRSTDVNAEKAVLQQSKRELESGLNAAREELAQARAESNGRAGFESLAQEREKTIAELRAELDAKSGSERAQIARVSELEADLRNERQKLTENTAGIDEAKQALANQFEALAGEILDKKSKSFTEDSQAELGNLLNPLREQLKEFREKVERVQVDSSNGVTKLETLIGTLGGLNQQLSEEARNLSTALRGSAKTQGDWGEFILRDLLEKAGLREGDQYSYQETFEGGIDEDGQKARSQRTDVIVFLPGGRHLIIDSKVSLNAYTDSVNAVTDEDRAAALKQHLGNIRSHVGDLARANYQGLPGIKTPDFVVMFIPVEPALLLALQSDAGLWGDAYEKGILLVGPTTLLYVIRIVSVLWRQEDQNRNVKEVMDHGAGLYAKFAAFINDMESLGSSLRNASESYEIAKKRLCDGRDNLVSQVEKFKELGVKPRLARSARPIPQKWLAAAQVDNGQLEFAAEAFEGDASEAEETAELAELPGS